MSVIGINNIKRGTKIDSSFEFIEKTDIEEIAMEDPKK